MVAERSSSKYAEWGAAEPKCAEGRATQLHELPSLRLAAWLAGGSCAALLLLAGAMFILVDTHLAVDQWWERQAVTMAFAMQAGGLLLDALTKQQLASGFASIRALVFTVKALAAATNLIILCVPTPFAVDSVTGRSNCMMRWVEWVVLSFVMTYLVDAIDGTSPTKAFATAASQSLSTLCGLLLPLCALLPQCARSHAWAGLLVVSFVLFFIIFVRLREKTHAIAILREAHPERSQVVGRAAMGLRLMRQCVGTWTALVAVWVVDTFCRVVLRVRPQTDWAFVADCAIDVAAKLLYASAILESAEAEPILYERQAQHVAEQKVRLLWEEARDVFLVSERLGAEAAGARVLTFASPSIADYLGPIGSRAWLDGRVHEVSMHVPRAPATEGVVSRSFAGEGQQRAQAVAVGDELVECHSFEDLLSYAYFTHDFVCRLTLLPPPSAAAADDATGPRRPSSGTCNGERGCPAQAAGPVASKCGHSRLCEVHSVAPCQLPGGRMVIVRDITDRVERHELATEAVRLSAARERDEEANRFTRHEVKTSVLSTLQQCEWLRSTHQEVMSLRSFDLERMRMLEAKLSDLHTGVQQTLEVVLSQAMASEVIHGVYVARTAPIQIEEVLRVARCVRSDELYPIVLTPASLPVVDLDPRLLICIYRNAMSNACKYGKTGGVVATHITLRDHILTLSVINESGEGHENLRSLDPQQIFAKGARFHENNPTVVSKGDGAWIMRKCAHCLQGTCDIRFEAARTVFTLTCPAPQRFDESYLDDLKMGPDVWAIGVDDCPFQRLILSTIFESLGIDQPRVDILGEADEEIENLTDTLVHRVEALPPYAHVIAVVDENLDLTSGVTITGSYMIKEARARLAPAHEGRLLAIVRSANDSPDEVRRFLECAHGFLTKSPTEPDAKALLRMFCQRFGFNVSTLRGVGTGAAAEACAGITWVDVNRASASSELRKVMRLLDGMDGMHWTETWRWLHRVKGIVSTVRASAAAATLGANSPADSGRPDGGFGELAECIVGEIEALRPLFEAPPDVGERWQRLKSALEQFLAGLEMRVANARIGER